MRIAFVKMKYVRFGGAETYLDMLARGCAARGHEVHLVTTEWPTERSDGLNLHIVPSAGRSRATRLPSFSTAAAAAIEKAGFDLSFSLDRTERQDIWRAGEGVHEVWLKRRHEFEPRWRTLFNERSAGHRALIELEKNCVANTPHIIANSRLVARDILNTYRIQDTRITVIHNGVDFDRFNDRDRTANRKAVRAELGVDEAEKVVLFVGSGFRHKGLAEALRAVELLGKGVLMIVLGRDNASPWQRRARKMGIAGSVRFLGARPAEAGLYHAADVTLMPTWSDSFGFVGLESLACGTPLVTTRYAGVSELVEPGIAGHIVSSPAAADPIVEALRSEFETGIPERRSAGIAESVRPYSIENNVERTVALMESWGIGVWGIGVSP